MFRVPWQVVWRVPGTARASREAAFATVAGAESRAAQWTITSAVVWNPACLGSLDRCAIFAAQVATVLRSALDTAPAVTVCPAQAAASVRKDTEASTAAIPVLEEVRPTNCAAVTASVSHLGSAVAIGSMAVPRAVKNAQKAMRD